MLVMLNLTFGQHVQKKGKLAGGGVGAAAGGAVEARQQHRIVDNQRQYHRNTGAKVCLRQLEPRQPSRSLTLHTYSAAWERGGAAAAGRVCK